MTFDLFDDLVSQGFHAPERNARHAAALQQAFSEANRLFGAFLRQAADDEEFASRWALIAADMQPIWVRHGLTTADQKTVGGRLKVSDTWENPNHKSDNCCTPDDAANPATSMPWGEAGPTPPQSGEEEFNDATLHHVASVAGWLRDSPVQGMDPGDEVAVTFDSYDAFSHQPVSGGEQGTVVDINGSDITVEIGGQDYVLPVQDLERLGSVRRESIGPLLAPILRTVAPMAVDALGDMATQDDDASATDDDSGFMDGVGDIAGGIGEGAQDLLMGNPMEGVGEVAEGFSDAFGGSDSGAPATLTDMQSGVDAGGAAMQKMKADPSAMGDNLSPSQMLNKDSRIATAWVWDSDSNAYKSAGLSAFACACGQQFQGVGQHRCLCGKVWNMSSIINGSKTAQEYPVYSCREVHTDPRLVLADVQNNGTGNDPAKGGPGGNEDPPQPDLEMEPDKDSYVEPFNANGKGAKIARALAADAGLWPLLEDKDIMANWKSLLGIILNPAQVSALEHEQYQQLIQELYEEINRRGLNSPVDPDQMQQGLIDPGQQLMNPTPKAIAYRRMGYNAALAGVSPAFDEPVECFQGWVLGLNKRLADSYQDRQTLYDGSEPAVPGHPVNNDGLDAGQNIDDPTPSQRSDFAGDADKRNNQGKSDTDTAHHVDDFEPEGQKTTHVKKADAQSIADSLVGRIKSRRKEIIDGLSDSELKDVESALESMESSAPTDNAVQKNNKRDIQDALWDVSMAR